MKALITGGAGFIGSHLADALLRQGHQVTALDSLLFGNKLGQDARRAVKLIEGDVRDRTVVARAVEGCEMIYHFAAVVGVEVVMKQPVMTMETEAMGLRNVTEAALEAGVRRIVYASSSDVYGGMNGGESMDEIQSVAPVSSYAVAKRFNEIYLASLGQERGLEAASIRYFNVYGPRQDERMVVPRFFRQAMAGEPVRVFSDGAQTRDFTYVDDAVAATLLVAEKFRGCPIVNVATGVERPIRDVAGEIIACCGSPSKVAFAAPASGRKPFEVARRVGSCARLREMTGFTAAVELRQGLDRTLAALRGTDGTGDKAKA
ncbi:MAG: NAD-dependent epimerase/dehydratase family protein [Verrucomicrobiae bacterium]|nr:NAD-dependent epimerase/dehydratase family protein [Verrucomicrobiae bacterium]